MHSTVQCTLGSTQPKTVTLIKSLIFNPYIWLPPILTDGENWSARGPELRENLYIIIFLLGSLIVLTIWAGGHLSFSFSFIICFGLLCPALWQVHFNKTQSNTTLKDYYLHPQIYSSCWTCLSVWAQAKSNSLLEVGFSVSGSVSEEDLGYVLFWHRAGRLCQCIVGLSPTRMSWCM